MATGGRTGCTTGERDSPGARRIRARSRSGWKISRRSSSMNSKGRSGAPARQGLDRPADRRHPGAFRESAEHRQSGSVRPADGKVFVRRAGEPAGARRFRPGARSDRDPPRRVSARSACWKRNPKTCRGSRSAGTEPWKLLTPKTGTTAGRSSARLTASPDRFSNRRRAERRLSNLEALRSISDIPFPRRARRSGDVVTAQLRKDGGAPNRPRRGPGRSLARRAPFRSRSSSGERPRVAVSLGSARIAPCSSCRRFRRAGRNPAVNRGFSPLPSSNWKTDQDREVKDRPWK